MYFLKKNFPSKSYKRWFDYNINLLMSCLTYTLNTIIYYNCKFKVSFKISHLDIIEHFIHFCSSKNL